MSTRTARRAAATSGPGEFTIVAVCCFALAVYGIAGGAAAGEAATTAVGVFAFACFVVGVWWPVAALAFVRVAAVAPTDASVGEGVALNVTWQRLWESRTELTNRPKQTQLLLMQQDSFMPLDTIDVDGVRFAREARTRLEQWQPGQPLPPEIQQDMFVQNMQGMVAARTGDKMRMIRENGYADTHPAVIAINDEIAALQRPLTNRVKTLIADRLQKMA